MRFVSKQLLYKPETPLDPDFQNFAFIRVAFSGNFHIVDAFPCDEDGNIAPGYINGIPTLNSEIGEPVNDLLTEE